MGAVTDSGPPAPRPEDSRKNPREVAQGASPDACDCEFAISANVSGGWDRFGVYAIGGPWLGSLGS